MIKMLGQLGDVSALEVMRHALTDRDPQIRYAAIQGVSAWPTAEPKNDLLRVAMTADDQAHKVLALRGYIDLVGKDQADGDAKVKMYEEAMKLAAQAAEKKRVLSGWQCSYGGGAEWRCGHWRMRKLAAGGMRL